MERAYWALRVGPDYYNFVTKELQAGRMRLGWGYDPSQDLRKIQEEVDAGGNWWERLSAEALDASGNLKMLDIGDGHRMKRGDVVLIPHTPVWECFSLVEIIGEYDYEERNFSKDSGEFQTDVGHMLPIKLLTPQGINNYNEHVHADIRRTMRCRSRIWSLAPYAEHIEKLLSLVQSNGELTRASDAEARAILAWEKAYDAAAATLKNELATQLSASFKAAEWEKPIAMALESLYPGARVDETGGPNENGADIVVTLASPPEVPLGSMKIVFQVKDYEHEINDLCAVDQLRQAIKHYGDVETKILGAIILTNAEKQGQEFEEALKRLHSETAVPTGCVLKNALSALMAEGLSKSSQQWR